MGYELIPIGQWRGSRIFKDIFGTIHTEVWFENEDSCSCGWGREFYNETFNITFKGEPRKIPNYFKGE